MLVQTACAEAGGSGWASKVGSLLEWRSFYADVVRVDPIIN